MCLLVRLLVTVTTDHCVIDFSFLIRDSRVDSSKDINSIEQASVRYKWHVSDFDAINSYLYSVPWEVVIQNNPSVKTSWSAFLDVLWSAIVRPMFVPSCNSSRRPSYRKRYPRHVAKLVAKKRFLWKKCMIWPNDLHVRWQYRECVNAYRAGCRKIAKQKEESIVDANNLGTFYRHVNQ